MINVTICNKMFKMMENVLTWDDRDTCRLVQVNGNNMKHVQRLNYLGTIIISDGADIVNTCEKKSVQMLYRTDLGVCL